MKTTKLFIGIIIVFLFAQNAKAQFSIGGQVSYLKLFGGTGLNGIGAGIKGEYASDERTVFTGSFNFLKGNKYTETTSAEAINFMTYPQYIDVESVTKFSFLHICGGAKRYFVGDNEDDFGFYGFAELGYMLIPIKTTLGNYDKTKYDAGQEDVSKSSFGNFTIGVGLGIEKELEFGYIFGDLKLNAPANKVNNAYVDVIIPASFSASVGVRIPLGR